MENINITPPLSPDWNAERLKTLKNILPDIFTNEGKLNIEELKKIIDPQSVTETERYEFRWFGKSLAKRTAFSPSDATLVFDAHRSINPTETGNIIIEGENLEVLKLLSAGYSEKIKCIYIDPPYNTGKDFVYTDNFDQDTKAYWEDAGVLENDLKVDTNTETDGRFHSNWMNMMFSRLLMARQLLREDGVIFISIDDNEVHHLRKLCDEVFGEENFVAEIVWKKRVSPANDAQWFSSDHEYVIIYAKNKEEWYPIRLQRNERQNSYYTNPDNDERGAWNSAAYTCNKSKQERPNLYYPILNPFTNELIYPKETAVWAYSTETHQEHVQQNLLYWGVDGSSKSPRKKQFLTDAQKVVPRSFLENSDVGSTQSATIEFLKIFEHNYFNYTKPVDLIIRFITLACEENDIILDFFSGSGTTGQAVMEMNAEDGGNRKFILVQIPEATDEKSEAYKAGYKKISDITIERNKRVTERILQEQNVLKEKEAQSLFTNTDNTDNKKNLDLGFKVFRLAASIFPRQVFAPSADTDEEEDIAELKRSFAAKEAQMFTLFNRNDLITEILIKKNFSLNYTLEKQTAFTHNEIVLACDGYKEMLMCLDNKLAEETVKYFSSHIDKKFLCLERALDSTQKYNLKRFMKENFIAF